MPRGSWDDRDHERAHRGGDADGRGGEPVARRRSTTTSAALARGPSRPTTSAGCGSTRRPTTAASRSARCARRSSRRRCGCCAAVCRGPAYVTASTVMGLENVLDEVERFRSALRPRAWPRPGHVLRPGVRGARRRCDVGLALRRPPRVGEPHDRRRRAGRLDALLPRRRPGVLAAARTAPAASAGRGRGPRARARHVARRRAARPGPAGARRARRPRHRQPVRTSRPATARCRSRSSSAAASTPTPTSGWPPGRRRWRPPSA